MTEQMIDPGMWSNLATECGTDDVYQIIERLYNDRRALVAECNDLRADLEAVTEDYDQERTTARNLSLLLDARNAELDGMRQQRDDARAWAAAWKRAAKRNRGALADAIEWLRAFGDPPRGWRAAEEAADKLLAANIHLKRACLAWWQAAHEAQDAQLRYRDADVSALVRAVRAAVENCETCRGEVGTRRCARCQTLTELIQPFIVIVRVPLRGEIGETPEEWEALKARVEADPRAMTPERIDAARPAALEGEGE